MISHSDQISKLLPIVKNTPLINQSQEVVEKDTPQISHEKSSPFAGMKFEGAKKKEFDPIRDSIEVKEKEAKFKSGVADTRIVKGHLEIDRQ